MKNNIIEKICNKSILTTDGCYHNDREIDITNFCYKIDKYVVTISGICEIIPVCNDHFRKYNKFFTRIKEKEGFYGNYYFVLDKDDPEVNVILTHIE